MNLTDDAYFDDSRIDQEIHGHCLNAAEFATTVYCSIEPYRSTVHRPATEDDFAETEAVNHYPQGFCDTVLASLNQTGFKQAQWFRFKDGSEIQGFHRRYRVGNGDVCDAPRHGQRSGKASPVDEYSGESAPKRRGGDDEPACCIVSRTQLCSFAKWLRKLVHIRHAVRQTVATRVPRVG